MARQDETERLAALRSYAILDTPPEAPFDDLTLLAARLYGAPMALIVLLDTEREWFKARLGVDLEQVAREVGFTAHVAPRSVPFVVPDASLDELLRANPLVTQAAGVRFVAGAPLVTSRGQLLGVLCVMDRLPRGLERDRLDSLAALGRQVLALLELRRARMTGSGVDWPSVSGPVLPVVGPGGEAGLSEAPSPAEVYEAAIRYLRGVPDVDHCALFLLSASRRELSHAFSHGFAADAEQAAVPVDGSSVVAHVARSGTRHLTHDARDDAGRKLAHPDARSELAIPLMAGGEVVGVLDLESRRTDAFPPAVVSLCESVASGISAALQGTNVTGLLLRAKVALEKTFDAMTDMVAILDSEGRIRRLNQAMASRLERPLRELVGEDFQVLFPFCRDWLAATSRTPPPGRSTWEEVVDPASQVVYELNMLELDIPTPVTGNRVVFMRDVTQEREMARQVIAFEKRAAAGDLLTGVAHEVRNPLAAIQAAAELLSQELPGDPDHAAPVGIICRQVERLKVLMQDLLHIGRPFDHLSVASGSLLQICEAAVGTWRENAGNRSQPVEILPQAREPFPVRVDAARIEQVIVNLLDNAAQHGRPGGTIQVLLSRSGGNVLLRVKDAGAGIAAEALLRVFEPFFTTRANGTGLGLTLVKSIVEGHGGGVSLWNNEPPPGLTFEVRLPAAPWEEP